uniref:Uncharacterized protein n=1 Tax=Rhizophora mucronata TaxID=61149 RepID=A0A2P2Q632_RHIMU
MAIVGGEALFLPWPPQSARSLGIQLSGSVQENLQLSPMNHQKPAFSKLRPLDHPKIEACRLET